MVFLKDPFVVLYYSFYILLLSVKSYLIHLQVINSMLMTLNSIHHSRLLTSHTILLTLIKLYRMSHVLECKVLNSTALFKFVHRNDVCLEAVALLRGRNKAADWSRLYTLIPLLYSTYITYLTSRFNSLHQS